MVIGSKAQFHSLNLDQFSVKLDSNKIEFVNIAKYLGLLKKNDLSWDDLILHCNMMNCCVTKQLLNAIHMSNPNQIMDSLARAVRLREIFADCKKFKISLPRIFLRNLRLY